MLCHKGGKIFMYIKLKDNYLKIIKTKNKENYTWVSSIKDATRFLNNNAANNALQESGCHGNSLVSIVNGDIEEKERN